MTRLLRLAALLTVTSMPVHATSTRPAPTAPTVDVYFDDWTVLHVQGPKGTGDYSYGLSSMITRPGAPQKALQWCWQVLKFSGCQLQVVGREGERGVLINSDVREMAYTPEGRWLVGMGNNTLRLWNAEQVTRFPKTKVLNMRGLQHLEVSRRHVCVTGREGVKTVYTVLRLPDLRVVKDQREVTGQGTFTPPPCP